MSELISLIRTGAKPVVGMVQLGPLPSSSRYRGGPIDGVLKAALREAQTLADHGVDVLMVQNLGDLPVASHASSAQVAWMTRVSAEIRTRFNRPVGLNLLENDAEAMFSIASAAGADFVRIKVYVGAMMTPFGIESSEAYNAVRARNACDASDVAILADVHDRTGTPIATAGFSEDVKYATRLAGADGLIVTGKSYTQSLEFIDAARKCAESVPILVGGGVTLENFAEVASLADAVIVSSSLKDSGDAFGRLAPSKVEAFMREVRRARSQMGTGAQIGEVV